MQDVTSPIQSNTGLESMRLERLNRLLFNNYPDAIYTIALDGTFHTVNHTVCQILQRERHELLGNNYQHIIHPEHLEESGKYFKAAKQGLPQRYQTVVLNNSGETVHLDVTNFPLKTVSDKMVGIFGIAKDITEQKERERALLRTTQELQRQNEELELFRKIIAHDFRSPVARLLGLGKLLQKDNLPEKTQQTALVALLQSAQQLDGMVRDLNQMLALHHQGDEPREKCDVEELVQLCVANIQQEISNAGATITLAGTERMELFTVKAFLVSIIQNLLSNAIKYRLPDRPLEVMISLKQQGDEAIIAVADNGTGMDLDKIGPSLFKMYKRFHQDIDGKGLGLYLVKEQVRLLQGRIEVASTPGLGTTFTVTLPMHS
ncbi:PAS domain-containing sensor histidine kinase [Pontibacter anaerobius]|uniref:histidine kinase n=1 Tax=Pontibacter anaerobius TaxID=2993940 RepID=A0ABT3REL1_9BACT|nr:PAS domain-containing sensor histidine kinase [Pontibacter anaerobius]MCX2740303.1 PAS domain-containing sensor histidine kinase [Pontibacter anaerobius]